MVLCLLALPVFAILAIFSVKYKKLTKDALECLFSTATLRKCRSGLDDRIKADLTGRVLKLSPRVAKFFYKNYKIISWIILLIFLWSIYTSAVGIYNYIEYGNCNGPEDTGFCIFDPTGKNSAISTCSPNDFNYADLDSSNKILPTIDTDDPIIGNKEAKLTIIEFGCYTCEYTKKVEQTLKEVLEYYNGEINIQFKTFYIPHHNASKEAALVGYCAFEQGKYEEFHKEIFSINETICQNCLINIEKKIGLNITEFEECMKSERAEKEINEDQLQGLHAGVQGTPTFFINDKVIVGPKPFKSFKKIIDEELKK